MSAEEPTRVPRVLIAEDDPTVRLVVAAALEADGLYVEQAEDGQQAIEAFERERPDLMVVDLNMPRVDGYELCARLRERCEESTIGVMILTGVEDFESIDRAYEVGATDFMTKPVNPHIFVRRVRYMLHAGRAFRRMREAREAAIAASEARVNFVARMSHEMRTPLTAILGFVGIARDEHSSASDLREALDAIHRNAGQLYGLVDDVLGFSQVEGGQLQLQARECRPSEIVSSVVESNIAQATAKGLALEHTLAPDTPQVLVSDAMRIIQILSNLVTNAIKFTDDGGVRVEARALEGSGGGVEFTVSDTGIGIEEADQSRVFEAFEQADNSMARAYQGVGLGLAIVKQLTEMLGGEIALESRPGAGSRFTVRLPGLETSPGASRKAAAGEGERTRLPEGCRILLVEDSPDNQRLIRALLTASGAEVALAEDGVAGVERALEALAADEPYDVILMDMGMPRLDGYGAAKKLRESGYVAPIVALTAHAGADERARCLRSGCDDYLTKPITRAKLIDTVACWLQKSVPS